MEVPVASRSPGPGRGFVTPAIPRAGAARHPCLRVEARLEFCPITRIRAAPCCELGAGATRRTVAAHSRPTLGKAVASAVPFCSNLQCGAYRERAADRVAARWATHAITLRATLVLARRSALAFQGRASKTRLNGVWAARRKCVKPASMITARNRASPACAPRAVPTSCASEAWVHTNVDTE